MRAELGPVALSVLYLVAGYGIVLALGLVRGVRSAVALVGVAYMAGIGTVLVLQTWVLSTGLAAGLPAVVAIAAVVGLIGLVVAVRRRGRGEPEPVAADPGPRWIWERVAVAVLAVSIVVVLVVGALGVGHMTMDGYDAWSIWTRKANLLFEFGRVPTSFFTSDAYYFMHPDYPLTIPAMEANWFRASGAVDTQGVHAQFWLLLPGFVAAAAWLVRPGRAIAWLPVLALVAFAPGIRGGLQSMYADVSMALFLGLGALAVGIWLRERRTAHLVLGGLFLAVAANVKNEGLTAVAAVLLAALLVAAVGTRGRRVKAGLPVVLTGIGVLVTVAPWRAFLAVNGIKGDLRVAQGLSPSFLGGRTERVRPAFDGLVAQLGNQGNWSLIVAVGAAAAVAAVAIRGLRGIGSYYLLAGVFSFALLVWGYWISPNEITWHVATSADRIIVAVVIICGVAGLHVASVGSVASQGPEAADSPPAPPPAAAAEPAGETRAPAAV